MVNWQVSWKVTAADTQNVFQRKFVILVEVLKEVFELGCHHQ